MLFRQFVESAFTPYVYHVTYYKNLPGISVKGLDSMSQSNTNWDSKYLSHAKTGNFFVDNIRATWLWIRMLEDEAHLTTKGKQIKKSGLFPVVLKFRLNRSKHQDDAERATPHDQKTNRVIPPQGLWVWAKKWIPITQWQQVPVNVFVDILSSDASHVKDPVTDDEQGFDDAGGDFYNYFANKRFN